MNLLVQVQVKPFEPSVQVAPFRQGELAHSSTSSAQVAPVKPGAQMQVKSPTKSLHWPPFRQGEETQSSMFTSQLRPVQPASQVHL